MDAAVKKNLIDEKSSIWRIVAGKYAS